MSFTIFQKENAPFQGIKTRSSESRKSDIFPKGLTHGFGPKWSFFHFFFLGNGGQENVFCDILERKNAFLGYKKKKFKKLENFFFSEGVNPCFWSKSGQFLKFFLGNIGQENVSDYILERKNAFQTIKTRSSNSGKIVIFSKGLTDGFGPKKVIFPTFFFEAVQARKMSFTIFQNKKTPFLAIKTRSSKSRKIDIFFKGVNPWSWSKNGHLCNCFFRQYRPGKCLLQYCRRKKRLSRL